MDMDIYDIIDNIYKLPLTSKETLLNEVTEVTYPKGFHQFLANRKKFQILSSSLKNLQVRGGCSLSSH